MCMPTVAIGWPTLDPWVETLNGLLLQQTCVCVPTAATGLPKLLNVQNLHLAC